MQAGVTAGDATHDDGAPRAATSRVVELLAVGGVTFVLFPLAWVLRRALGLDEAELAVGFTMFQLAHVLNDPHFSVTYLLFYRDARERARDGGAAQRARYVVVGVVVPVVLVGWAAVAIATRSAQTLGWLVQLMFLTVGWHYAKQGFGVLTVLSARRGVRFTPVERRVILAHCYAAWAFAWASPATLAGRFEEKGVVYWAPAKPWWLEASTGVALAASSVALAVVLARKWRRERVLPFAPLAVFLVTIWLWTVWTTADRLVQYVIPALHSVQYLYFVWLSRRNEARAAELPPTFGRPAAMRVALLAVSAVALGWLLLRGVPAWLDASCSPHDAALGPTPFFAAFFVVVNVHHYFMDAVIWRRESPDAKWLVA